ncbi:[FeFe] hydrogenase H-cluster maturation GTPase HydF, partial [Lachnotalea glycerini]
MSLTKTPRANQLHIGIYGKRNSGKSSLINAITSQDIALVSEIAGTTTDPVYKTMEISGIGPCVFIDTAGFDDEGELGNKRIERTKQALEKTDIAIVVCSDYDLAMEKEWIDQLKKAEIPFIACLRNTSDAADEERGADHRGRRRRPKKKAEKEE